jgi:hypothetical protein
MDPPLFNTSSTSQNACGTLNNRLPRRRVQADANHMCCTLERSMIQVRSGTFHDREAPPPEATTAPLVHVTAMRAAHPAYG